MTTRRTDTDSGPRALECDERCGCGNLLARRTDRGIEIKCRRCKRVYIIDVVEGGLVSRGPPD